MKLPPDNWFKILPPDWALRPSQDLFTDVAVSLLMYFFHMFLSGLHSQGWLIWKIIIIQVWVTSPISSEASDREFHILTTLVEKKWCL